MVGNAKSAKKGRKEKNTSETAARRGSRKMYGRCY